MSALFILLVRITFMRCVNRFLHTRVQAHSQPLCIVLRGTDYLWLSAQL